MGVMRWTRFARAEATLSREPPDGPVTQEVTYSKHAPWVVGRVNPDGWVDWPHYYG